MKKLKFNFSDPTTEKAEQIYYQAGDIAADAGDGMVTALAAISEANITGYTQTAFSAADFGAKAAGPYNDASDKLTLEFTGSNGQLYKYDIPSPAEDIFQADNETLDPTGPDVPALLNAFTTHCVDATGGTLTFKRGYRSWKNRKS